MVSFGKATRANTAKKASQLPGPGQYQPSMTKSTPAFSVGKGVRSGSKSRYEVPGPGQYQTIQYGNGPQYSIALKSSYGSVMGAKKGKEGGIPGPGQYQQNLLSKSIAYTFGIKSGSVLDKNQQLGLPGPGQYDLSGSNIKFDPNKSRGPGFGTEKRAIGGLVKSTVEIPGPGQYTIDHQALGGPRYGFGTQKRNKGGIVNTEGLYVPGPGQYNKEEEIGKTGPMCTMKFRAQSATSKSIDAPGPGAYNPNFQSIKQQTPGNKIGTSKRDGEGFSKNSKYMPGPGQFTIEYDWTKLNRNAGFGASNRVNVASSKEGPGPGNYNPSERNLSTAPAYTLGYKKHAKDGGYFNPGPGAYNPRVEYAKENIGGVKIGTSVRDGINMLGGKDMPGPGQYHNSGQLGGPAYRIGSSNRGQLKSDQTPGPGQYKVPTYISNLPKYTMPDRPENLRYI